MMDEGVIKFNCNWQKSSLPAGIDCTKLLQTRNELFQLGLIGFDETEKVGYGNISTRVDGNQFIISGTQTGHIPVLSKDQLSFVSETIIATNTVYCSGPAKASSESMTHAAIYQLIPAANAVIHIHHNGMWEKLKHQLPTTKNGIGYGTQAMANEIERLLKENDLLAHRLLVMAGHQDGIISFGETMEAAAQALLKYCA
jgi:L-ribulose-5-phosphate 4-epimerase